MKDRGAASGKDDAQVSHGNCMHNEAVDSNWEHKTVWFVEENLEY